MNFILYRLDSINLCFKYIVRLWNSFVRIRLTEKKKSAIPLEMHFILISQIWK